MISFDNVSKVYRLGSGQRSVFAMLRGLAVFGGHGKEPILHQALDNVSFVVQEREVLGLIGPNGAGKSTILRLLAGITYPSSGRVRIQGRVAALIALGAGFHPDLTGRENVYLNGVILGLSKEEVHRRLDEIVSFSGLARFIDTPVKRYSSGMYARLGFAVAAHVDPDVLLVDEVLSVGDTAFQARCMERMDQLRQRGTTLVFVSHNMNAIQRVCSRVLVISRGKIEFEGAAPEAIAAYGRIIRRNDQRIARPESPETGALQRRETTGQASIHHVKVCDSGGQQTDVISVGERFCIEFEIEFHEAARRPVFACTVSDAAGQVIYDVTSRALDSSGRSFTDGERACVKFEMNAHLLNGNYNIKVDAAYQDLSCYYDYVANAAGFVVVGGVSASGTSNLQAELYVKRMGSSETAHSTWPDSSG